MFNLIRSEIYRVLHKRSFYIYFGTLAALYALFLIIRLGGMDDSDSVGEDAMHLFGFLPALAGGYLFATLFNDDLSSKTLSTLIGFGISKTKIVLSKLVLMAGFGAVIFGLVPLFMYIVYAVFGHVTTGESLAIAYANALSYLMAMLAFSAIAAIVVYGLQRTTFAIVIYILLALGQIDQLIVLAFSMQFLANLVPNIQDYLITGVTATVKSKLLFGVGNVGSALALYGCYVVAATGLAIAAFRKKELEF
jgi:ABC-type transport system involved in multi-copper enzyme maturation permease subunit